MNALYSATIKFNIIHEVDDLQDIVDLKTDRELAEDIAHMIVDETIVSGGVCTYEIIESSVDVQSLEKSVTFFLKGELCATIVKGRSKEEIIEKVKKRFPLATGINVLM